jgi:site-specific DNA recombinase
MWHGHWQRGKHVPIVDRQNFQRVQSLLGEKDSMAHELLYAGELISCGHCGRPITSEIVKKQSGKEYVYYRCARYTSADHPRIRLREDEVDAQVRALFDKLQQPEPVREWFREALIASTLITCRCRTRI